MSNITGNIRMTLLTLDTIIFPRFTRTYARTQVEQSSGGAYLPIAVKSRSDEIVYLQLDSRLSLDSLNDAMTAAMSGCRKLRVIMQDAIKSHMASALQRNGAMGV
jgi:hypothetical protein